MNKKLRINYETTDYFYWRLKRLAIDLFIGAFFKDKKESEETIEKWLVEFDKAYRDFVSIIRLGKQGVERVFHWKDTMNIFINQDGNYKQFDEQLKILNSIAHNPANKEQID